MQAGTSVIGSTLLFVVDRLALEVLPTSGNISTGNISEYRSMVLSPEELSRRRVSLEP